MEPFVADTTGDAVGLSVGDAAGRAVGIFATAPPDTSFGASVACPSRYSP